MDCKEFRELLDLYVDGELSPEASLSARTHLEGCMACRRVERQLSLLRQAVRRVVNEHEPPSELVRQVSRIGRRAWPGIIMRLFPGRQTRPEVERTRPSFWRRKMAIPAPALASLLIVMLTLSVLVITRRSAEPPRQAELRRVEPAAPLAASGELDLAQFDRGARAAIYKVRRSDGAEQDAQGEGR
jgi:anti-sigma factor RsiW